MNSQQFNFIQRQAEEILSIFQSKYKFPNGPPVLVDMIAQDLELERRPRNQGYLDNRIRGALFAHDRVIYIDETYHRHQRVFTVAHEIGHWVLHEGNRQLYVGVPEAPGLPLSIFLKDPKVKSKKEEWQHRETQANRFAAALLIPRSFLFSLIRDYEVIDARAVEEIARVFCVSRIVVIYRIKDICRYGEWIGPRVDEESIDQLEAKVTVGDQTRKRGAQPTLFRNIARKQWLKGGSGGALAKHLHKQRQDQVRRANHPKPYVVEFAGMPNGGKDTLISILVDRLRDAYGYKVEIIDEVVRDKNCSASKRLDINGLYQKISATVTRLIEVAVDNPRNVDFVILNRGVFDALAWVDVAFEQGDIDENQRRVLTNYLLGDSLVQLIDEVFLILISREEALRREYESKGKHVAMWLELDGMDPKKIRAPRFLNKRMLGHLSVSYYKNYYENEKQRRFAKVHLLDMSNENGSSIEESTRCLAQVFPRVGLRSLDAPSLRTNGRHQKKKSKQEQLQLPFNFLQIAEG